MDSPRSVRARCFHFFDHTKNYQIPSILKSGSQMRFTKYHPARDEPYESPTPVLSTESQSPSERILKIMMPHDILDDDSAIPSSFSPPSNILLKKKSKIDYRELSYNNECQREVQRERVRFHSKVLVMKIPSRLRYPESMKRNMWCSLSEIARSAQRNTIEFSSEGWDWRNAVEEDSMYIHPKTGQYVHPVHVRRACSSTSSKSTTPEVDEQEKVSTVMEANSEVVNDDTGASSTDRAQLEHE